MHGISEEDEIAYWRKQAGEWRYEHEKAATKIDDVASVLDAANVSRVTETDDPAAERNLSPAERVQLLVAQRDEARRLAEESARDKVMFQKECQRLTALINAPRTDEFFEAVRIEAAHQIERWGVEHDAGKRPEDWLALFLYLLGKATKAHYDNNREKLLHHIITVAAVALNWHRNATGVSTAMRPGVAPSSAGMDSRRCPPGFTCVHDVRCKGAT